MDLANGSLVGLRGNIIRARYIQLNRQRKWRVRMLMDQRGQRGKDGLLIRAGQFDASWRTINQKVADEMNSLV